jgi:hypothetical protein
MRILRSTPTYKYMECNSNVSLGALSTPAVVDWDYEAGLFLGATLSKMSPHIPSCSTLSSINLGADPYIIGMTFTTNVDTLHPPTGLTIYKIHI